MNASVAQNARSGVGNSQRPGITGGCSAVFSLWEILLNILWFALNYNMSISDCPREKSYSHSLTRIVNYL